MIDKFGLQWLRKGSDYFWVDDKDFEKNGERWKKNGDFDEVIANGTIIRLGSKQDNDRAQSFAGKQVMLGNGNRVEEVTEDGDIIVRDSNTPIDTTQFDITSQIQIREPVLRCSILVENEYLRVFGAQHHWLKTSKKEVGAEKADGDPRNAGGNNLFNLPFMTLRACAPGSSSQPGASCEIVRGLDINIVNSELEIGKQLPGRWGVGNNCQTVVDQVLENSVKLNAPDISPKP